MAYWLAISVLATSEHLRPPKAGKALIDLKKREVIAPMPPIVCPSSRLKLQAVTAYALLFSETQPT